MEHDDTKHNAGVEETLLCSSYNLKRLCCTTLVHSTCLNPAPNYEKNYLELSPFLHKIFRINIIIIISILLSNNFIKLIIIK